MRIGNRQLVFDLLKLINTRCYRCNEIATKMIRYNLIFDGEAYKCDICPNPPSKHSSENVSDLFYASTIREINQQLDNHEFIDIELIKQLYFCIYPKCQKCEHPATKEIKYKPILHSQILRCDNCEFKKKMNNGLILADPEIIDLPSAKLIREIYELIPDFPKEGYKNPLGENIKICKK